MRDLIRGLFCFAEVNVFREGYHFLLLGESVDDLEQTMYRCGCFL